jgi:hypothetical protein
MIAFSAHQFHCRESVIITRRISRYRPFWGRGGWQAMLVKVLMVLKGYDASCVVSVPSVYTLLSPQFRFLFSLALSPHHHHSFVFKLFILEEEYTPFLVLYLFVIH